MDRHHSLVWWHVLTSFFFHLALFRFPEASFVYGSGQWVALSWLDTVVSAADVTECERVTADSRLNGQLRGFQPQSAGHHFADKCRLFSLIITLPPPPQPFSWWKMAVVQRVCWCGEDAVIKIGRFSTQRDEILLLLNTMSKSLDRNVRYWLNQGTHNWLTSPVQSLICI